MINVNIKGVDDIVEVLNRVGPKASRNLLRSTVHGMAGEIAKDMRRGVAVDKGVLKKAIKTKRKRTMPGIHTSEILITHGGGAKYDAYYWHFVEFGTGGDNPIPEKPFIRPAVQRGNANRDKIMVDQFGKKLVKAMSRKGSKL